MPKKKEESMTTEKGIIRIWLTSGNPLDVEAEYFVDNGPTEIEDGLSEKVGIVSICKDMDYGIYLTLKAEMIAGWEWL